MVRFKNRYILAELLPQFTSSIGTQKQLIKLIKEQIIEMMGEVLLAKVTFSLQIKYFYLGKCVIRVPRQYLNELVACLFPFKGLKIIQTSGTIIRLQKRLITIFRKELLREPNGYEQSLIKQIDYS